MSLAPVRAFSRSLRLAGGVLCLCLSLLSLSACRSSDRELLSVVRMAKGGDQHAFDVAVPATGELLIVLRQSGLDAGLSVDAGGRQSRFESGTGRDGEERVVIPVPTPGSMRVSVIVPRLPSRGGRYELLVKLRPHGDVGSRLFSHASQKESGISIEQRIGEFKSAAWRFRWHNRSREAALAWLAAAYALYEGKADPRNVQKLAELAAREARRADAPLLLARALELSAAAKIDFPRLTDSIAESVLHTLDGAQKLYAAYSDDVGSGQVMTYRGLLYLHTDQASLSEPAWTEAARLCRDQHEELCEIRGRQNLGYLYRDDGKLDQAIAQFRAADALMVEEDDPVLLGDLNDNLGFALRQVGDFDAALKHHTIAMRAYAGNGRCEYAGRSIYGIAHALMGIGDLPQAAWAYAQVINGACRSLQARSIAMPSSEVEVATAVQAACASASRIVPVDLDQRIDILLATWDLGDMARFIGHPGTALKCHETAQQLAHTENSRLGTSLEVIDDLLALESGTEARRRLDMLSGALAKKPDDPDRDGYRARALILKARTQEDAAEAMKSLLAARQIYSLREDREGEFEALRWLSKLGSSRTAGGADSYFAQADALLEQIRSSSRDPTFRASLFAHRRDLYADWAGFILRTSAEADRAVLGLAVSERSRGRLLQDMLDGYRGSRVDESSRPEFSVAAAIASVLIQRARDPVAVREIIGEEASAEPPPSVGKLELEDLHTSAAALRELTKRMPHSSAMVEYLLGEQKSYVWVVRSGAITIVELAKRAEIRDAVKTLLGALEDDDPGRLRTALAGVYELIMRPIDQHIGESDLVISPDDDLYRVPFAALWDGDRQEYLVERHAISYVPSLRYVTSARSAEIRHGKTSLLMIADPVYDEMDSRARCNANTQRGPADARFQRLRAADTEATQIAALFRSVGASITELRACDATRERFIDANLKDHAYVHIAAHASVDLAVPQYSVIHLSRYDADGRSIPGSLSMRDVIEHEFNTELVTLSGCSTAGGRVFSGDGALGLSFAILAGGSEAVLSTMWDASDAATAEVMNAFYRELIVNDIAAARALRLAQLSLLNESKWKSPRFWAAYALIGRPPTTNVSQPQ